MIKKDALAGCQSHCMADSGTIAAWEPVTVMEVNAVNNLEF